MKHLCAPLLAGFAAALLAACASQPAPSQRAETVSRSTRADTLQAQAVTVSALSPDDPGIAALARAVSGAGLVSFEGGQASQESLALKSALSEALLLSGSLSLIILDVPCDGAAILDDYTRGAPTSTLAADLVRAAPIPDGQKTAALADMLTLLRGWNAVNADQPARVAGMHCAPAAEGDVQKTALFWGLDQLPAHTGEKDMAAAAMAYGEPAENHIWLAQTDAPALADVIPASGWIDLRALPERADVAAWRQDMAVTLPLLRAAHPSAADILFKHPASTSADPF